MRALSVLLRSLIVELGGAVGARQIVDYLVGQWELVERLTEIDHS